MTMLINTIKKRLSDEVNIFLKPKYTRVKLKKYQFDNIIIHSFHKVNEVAFDHCCHPKFGDDIVALRDGKIAHIHHKLCDNAYERMKKNTQMLFCNWVDDTFYTYKMVVSLPNTRGEMARLLTYLASNDVTILL